MIRFEAYSVALELIRSLCEPVAAIARHDPDLARQLRRAATSVPLNLREGNRRTGRDRLHLFRVAYGSAAEAAAALEVAQAWGYLNGEAAAQALAHADRVQGMIWGLTR